MSIDNVEPWWWNTWLSVEALFPPGTTFKFLGRDMIVISHSKNTDKMYPSINCNYFDFAGILQRRDFILGEWECIKEILSKQLEEQP